jgi:DNA-binding NtrC family response regulator
MLSRLVLLNGPGEGQLRTFAERLTIGRHQDNGLVLKDPALSRHHLELLPSAEGCRLRDLGSRHGSFVNQKPVSERWLEHGDSIQIGNSLLLYLNDQAEPKGAEATVGSTFELPVGEAAAAFWKAAAGGESPSQRALIELARGLLGLFGLGEVGRALAAAVGPPLPARLVAVVHLDPASGEWHWLYPAEIAPADASRVQALLEQFLDQVEARLCLVGEEAALLAPLFARGRQVGGLVLLRGGAPAAGFTPADLELASAAAGLAALAIENIELSQWRLPAGPEQSAERKDHGLLGESAAIKKLRGLIERVARADSAVLLHGESGSGKELVARAIHRASGRSGGPWVVVNCATLTENLLESELFGHEKGAFTGALQRRLGKFESASGGTLFLDEIAEIPLGLQAKLLRVLQEGEIERIGGGRPIAVDVRVIAASHRDLARMCQAGAFREDLFYRLNVVGLELPPLRERPEDIPLLAQFFARESARRLGRPLLGLAAEARAALLAYAWPGNVRQLANVIERAAVLGDGQVIRLEDLPDEIVESGGQPAGAFQSQVAEAKKQSILLAWRESGGDYQKTAEKLGIHLNSLHRLVRQLNLKPALFSQQI